MTERYWSSRSGNSLGWAAGRTFGERYVAERLIGEGGWAETYLGQDQLLGRAVALKLLRSQFAGDPALVDRFEREARIAASISHPNVVAVYDFGTEGETFYIALQYIAGKDLKRYLAERGRMQVPEAVEITSEILKGLGAIHRAGIVHRDVKPQNVLLGDDGLLRITDFGIAHQSLATRVTSHGAALGTAAYMAPEQAKGGAVTPATDLYALGVLLFELLTGRLPFERDNPMATLLAHVQELPPRIGAVAPDADVPLALEAVVDRALDKEPAARFASAPEMLAALAHATGGAAEWIPPQAFGAAEQTTRVNPVQGERLTGGVPPGGVPPPTIGGALPPPGRGRAAPGASGRGWLVALVVVVVAVAAIAAAILLDPWGDDDDPRNPGGAAPTSQTPSPTARGTLTVLQPIPTATATAELTATAEATETEPIQPTVQPRPTETPEPTEPPTETPPPTETETPPPTESPTPDPTATEEAEPTAPATSTQEIVAIPDDQGESQADGSVLYQAAAWQGGADKKKDQDDEVASVEAHGGPKATATLAFSLEQVPAGGVTISLQARREDEGDQRAALVLAVNDAAAPEPLDISAAGESWGTIEITVPATVLTTGTNVLQVTAERDGDGGGKPPTVLLGRVVVTPVAAETDVTDDATEEIVDVDEGSGETSEDGGDEAPTISPS